MIWHPQRTASEVKESCNSELNDPFYSYDDTKLFMPKKKERLLKNLERLQQNLTSCCKLPTKSAVEKLRLSAEFLPLSHSTSEAGLVGILESDRLLSRSALTGSARHADKKLGRTDDVCFYFGTTSFPNREIGFLFVDDIALNESKDIVSTPFDSGGCVSRYPLPEGTDAKSFVESHQLPVPECRDYLYRLLLLYFSSIEKYLENDYFYCSQCGQEIDDPHGFGAVEKDALTRQHEVRISGSIEFSQSLIAIFLPKTHLNHPQTKPYLLLGRVIGLKT